MMFVLACVFLKQFKIIVTKNKHDLCFQFIEYIFATDV